jgi:hypothetical protein
MKIGDKVRLLRGTEEGRIIAFKGNKIVDIEIEDGFVIPALINEVVVIDKKEAESFDRVEQGSAEAVEQRKEKRIADGLYIGFDTSKTDQLQGYLINQTTSTILYSISQHDKKRKHGKAYGICEKFEVKEIGTYTTAIFNESKKLHIQLIYHQQQMTMNKQPMNIDLAISKEMLGNQVFVESISKEIAIINLRENVKLEIDVQALKEKMMEPGFVETAALEKTGGKQAGLSIDLHVDADAVGLSSSEVLEYQLNEFEKAFDNALVMNCEYLKVIHGIGNGILRNEIHKRLSKKPTVKFFEDADKERFGFGSTIIYF